MLKESEKHAEEDRKKKDAIELKNNAENLIYTTEKLLDESKDRIDKETAEKIQKEIDELKEVVKEDNADKIKKKLDEVNKTVQEIGMKMYQKSSEEQSKSKRDDNAVDAEVVDEDEKK